MTTPTVFIGMPVYNGERHLSEAIESILSQTYEDFTLYISDDASNEATRAIGESYAARDPRIVYVRQAKNLGMFGNMKFVLEEANGKYFMWAAQDDLREPEYLAVCVKKLEENDTLGVSTTTTMLIDTFGRTLATEEDMQRLSGRSGIMQIARYTLQHEGLGKCNLTYGLFRTNVARAVWQSYPYRKVWGPDYHFILALVSRYAVYVDPKPFFKKRLGGYSSESLALTKEHPVRLLSYKDRSSGIPFKNFPNYFAGHMEAVEGTPYQLLVAVLLYLRLPYSFLVYMRERNYKKFFRRIIGTL